MKKILFVLMLLPSLATADSCATNLLGPGFTADQAKVLCKFFGGSAQIAATSPTLVATPVAGTNMFMPGVNVVPTVAANAAAFLGPATPVPGQRFLINNAGANSVRIKAAGGATLNGATAGGYIALPTLATVECFTASSSNQVCMQPVIPTPAGP